MKTNNAFAEEVLVFTPDEKKDSGLNLPCSNDHLKQRLHDINGSHLHMCECVRGGGVLEHKQFSTTVVFIKP
jgi:hypothetical protein